MSIGTGVSRPRYKDPNKDPQICLGFRALGFGIRAGLRGPSSPSSGLDSKLCLTSKLGFRAQGLGSMYKAE